MPKQKVPPAALGPPGALAMPDWQAGGELTAGELRLEQKYQLQRLRRHLRLVHGWGVVCGLNIVPAGQGWELFVCPGYGIGPCGDEIVVPYRYRFNLSDYLWTRPIGARNRRAWIAVESAEDPAAYESAPPEQCGCGCAGSGEKISRLADSFRIVTLWTPPLRYGSDFNICGHGTPRCPPCPDNCALPLASVVLPAVGEAILASAIDNLEY